MRRAAVVIAMATLLSTVLRALVPINPIGLVYASFDGGLFERLAVSLVHHDWLGGFTATTLAKGPGYMLFMAGAYWAHLPLQVAEQLAYLVGALSIALAIGLVTRRPGIAAAAYVVLAFDPVNYSAISTYITRENFYTSVALLFIGTTFIAVYAAVTSYPLWLSLVAGAAAGVSGAWFWITREEGVWVIGALGLILGALGLGYLRTNWRRGALRSASVLVILAVTFVAPMQLVKHKNKQVYGEALVTDFASGSFPAAYAAWSRVRGVPLRTFVPVDTPQRVAMYPLSPAAAKLEPFLEDTTNAWRTPFCKTNNVCDDYTGGAEPWAFRDAALAAGLYQDEPAFQKYFAQLAQEVNAACASGAVRCSRQLPSSLQLAQRSSPGKVVSSAWTWLKLLPAEYTIYQPYGVSSVNHVPASERRVIASAVRNMPRTQRGGVRDAQRYQSRDWIFGLVRSTYRQLWRILIALALVTAVACAVPRNRPRSWACVVLAASLFGAVITRLIIFGVIETTQYFNDMRYQLVAHTFLLASLVALVAIAPEQAWARWLWAQLRSRVRPRSVPGSA